MKNDSITLVPGLSNLTLPQKTQAAPKTNAIATSLISPVVDAWLIGGASIVTCLLYWMFVDSEASVYRVSYIAFYASMVVNWPHFMSSYQLLYGDYRKRIMDNTKGTMKFFWAGIVVPMALVFTLFAAYALRDTQILSYLVQVM